MAKGLSSHIKNLIIKLYNGTPLTPEEDGFCMDLRKEQQK